MAMITDPEAIQAFRNKLLDLVEQLRQQMTRTESAMTEVNTQWKDVQFEKLYTQYEADMEVMTTLTKDIEEYESGPLAKLQYIAQEYLDL